MTDPHHLRTSALPWENPDVTSDRAIHAWRWRSLSEERDGVTVSMWKLDPGGADQVHHHDDTDEHIFVLVGEFRSGGSDYQAGDYLFRPAGTPHSSSTKIGTELLLITVRSGQRPGGM